ncbi:spore cortex biosynthesis protein YabQ [Caldalkalibacillus salinus]|uniref:spore cortex biosynthesis protein YabQ n=1 Tax=Caldalkalibacillus salinus TaxID=2803787 RepID=UPI0019212CDC|nr:spore cortex biosynthesis protein YabQ [Caldalkalibacillus salinus]
MSLTIQALTMLHMVGAGLYLGASHDTYARLRLKKNQWLTFVQDFLFWLLNGLFIFLWLQWVNEGVVRVYIFLSLLCGYAMYRALFQNLYRRTLDTIIRIVAWSYHTVIKVTDILLIKPMVYLYKMIIALIVMVMTLLLRIGQFGLRFLGVLWRPLGRLISRLRNAIATRFKRWLAHKIKKKEVKKGPHTQQQNKKEGFFIRMLNRLLNKFQK